MNALQLNLYDAKTQLSALVERAAAGAEIIIAKGGKPMAKLVPFRQTTRRKPGSGRKNIWIAKDFNAPLPDSVIAGFSGDASKDR